MGKKGQAQSGQFNTGHLMVFIIVRILWIVGAIVAIVGLNHTWKYVVFNFDCRDQDKIAQYEATDVTKQRPLFIWDDLVNFDIMTKARRDEILSGCSSCAISQIVAVGIFGAQISAALCLACVVESQMGLLTAILNGIFLLMLIVSLATFMTASGKYEDYYGKKGRCSGDSSPAYPAGSAFADASGKCPGNLEIENPGNKYFIWLIIDCLWCVLMIIVGIVCMVTGLDVTLDKLCL